MSYGHAGPLTGWIKQCRAELAAEINAIDAAAGLTTRNAYHEYPDTAPDGEPGESTWADPRGWAADRAEAREYGGRS